MIRKLFNGKKPKDPMREIRFLFISIGLFFLIGIIGLLLNIEWTFGGDPQARKELEKLGLEFTRKEYMRQVKKGDIQVVDFFLRAGMDIDRRLNLGPRTSGPTALEMAAGNGDMKMVKFLVEKGSDFDLALKRAQEKGHTDIVIYLKSQGEK